MPHRVRALTFVLVATAATLVSSQTARPPAPAPSARASSAGTEILWDRWGVPHIFAANAADAFYAFGQAQMASHGDLLLRLYGQARGRGAEYWGADHLDMDKYVRTMGVPARARDWATKQTPAFRPLLDAFVAGINSYARQHPERLAKDVQVVLPVEPADVLAHAQRVICFTFVTNPQSIQGAGDRWSRGSNTWAVAPKRTAAGRTLLLANPHLPWGDLFTWYEAQISTAGVNAYGAALVGMPFLGIAFNDVLGWSHTNNTMDGSDLYELELADGGYRWNNAVRPFETTTETIKVKQADGTMKEESQTVRRSVHGPVVSEKPGRALAVRVVGLDAPNIGDQYWNMIRAKTLAEFQAALRPLQNPFFTVMYADRAGQIMHLFGGRTPVRPAGTFDWAGIVSGTSDATLWTTTHPYDELPKVIDPPSGWLQNANDPPWTTTFPAAIDPSKFPTYMAPRTMSLRAQQSASLVESNPSFTLDSFIAAKHSTRLALADRVLDDLLAAVAAAGAISNGEPHPAAAAATVLAAWDRSTNAESQGAILFDNWYRRLARSGFIFTNRWSETSPRTTPSGLRDPAAAVAALAASADEVQRTYGRLDVAWGDVYRLRIGGRDLPANGGGGDLGIFRVVGFTRDPKDGRMVASSGDSYVAAIEFGPTVRARSLIAYGNASQPGSPHIGDQLELFAKKQLKPVWLTRTEIEGNLGRRETVRR